MQAGLTANLRNLVSLVDRLRDFKLDKLISLPRIVVIGSQSAGKSSLLQQIVGLDFLPRGSGIVTRRPLQIRLVYSADQKSPYATFEEVGDKKFTDFNQVRRTIEQVTDKVCGNNKDIVDKKIVLQIFSNSCPDLTLVDLPGITKVALPGQNPNILNIVMDLTKSYITDPRTVILCAIAANTDLSTSDALKLAREIDPEGSRTLGVLTKIDIMDRGTDARSILLNKEIPLKLGYIAVKNRCQADVLANRPVKQSLEEQMKYFSTSPIYSSLPKNLTGTSNLVTKLSQLIYNSIKSAIPQIIGQLKSRKQDLKQRLDKIGPDPQFLAENAIISVQLTIRKIAQSLEGLGEGSVRPQILSQIKKFLEDQKTSDFKQFLSEDKLNLAINCFSSDAIPGYASYHAFQYLMTPVIQSFSQIAISLNYSICNIVFQGLSKHVNSIQQAGLRNCLLNLLEQSLQSCKSSSTQSIYKVMECQQRYLYTSDVKGYCQTLKEYEGSGQTSIVKSTLIRQVVCLGRLIAKQLRELIPKQIALFMLYELKRVFEKQVFNRLMNKEDLKQLLQEDKTVTQLRIKLKADFQTLQKAEEHLRRDAQFGSLFKNQNLIQKAKIKQGTLFFAVGQKIAMTKGYFAKVMAQRKAQKQAAKPQPAVQTPKQVTKQTLTAQPKKPSPFANVFGQKTEAKPAITIKQPPPSNQIPAPAQPKQVTNQDLLGFNQPKQQPRTSGIGFAPTPQPKPSPSVLNNMFGLFSKGDKKQINEKTGAAVDSTVEKAMQNQKAKGLVKTGVSSAFQTGLASQGVSAGMAQKLGDMAGSLATSKQGYGFLKDATKQGIKKKTDLK